jgi:hypothetical protein
LPPFNCEPHLLGSASVLNGVAEQGIASLSLLFMNTKIDIKSALIGLLLGALVTFGIAASSGSSGRYQVAGTSSYGLVLDTMTGQVWTMFCNPGGGRTDGEAFFLPKPGK